MGPLIKYTDRLYDLFDEIGGKIAQNLIKLEGDPSVTNDYFIKLIDVSEDDFCFEVTNTEDDKDNMKVGAFVRHFLEKTWTDQEFFDFISDYNGMKKRYFNGSNPKKNLTYGYGNYNKGQGKKKERIVTGTPVEIPPFVFNPKDIRSTFISLVTSTYPHGHEEEVVPFIKGIGLQKDIYGNYYKIVGRSKTMFTSHLDTADRKKSKVTLLSEMKGGNEILKTNGSTILGADDKAGVTVMLYMISNNIPGIYYFFIGEERGGIGSYKVADTFDTFPHLKEVERCVSFDRRNNVSVITSQLGRRCCSDTFAKALCDEYSKGDLKLSLDSTGVYTDSASFIDYISECTNISVGYMHEHTINEFQDITYLEKLAKASLLVNWESLPATRKSGLSDEVKRKYGKFLSDLKRCKIDMDWELISENGEAHVFVEMEGTIYDAHLDLMIIEDLCQRHKIDPIITFENYYFKLELK